MKTLIALGLVLLCATGAVAGYVNVDFDAVTSVVSHPGSAEPARLLMCGSALMVLSAAVRRWAF